MCAPAAADGNRRTAPSLGTFADDCLWNAAGRWTENCIWDRKWFRRWGQDCDSLRAAVKMSLSTALVVAPAAVCCCLQVSLLGSLSFLNSPVAYALE